MQHVAIERPFVAFSYHISHGILVFRSGKSNVHRQRIDVVFKDVTAMECRMSLNNLFIDEIDPSNVTNSAIRIAEGISKEQRIFQIRSSDWTGFVVAGAMFVFEDDGEFMARNPAFEEDL